VGLAIIQTAFPGDVILTGGLVRSVREIWPDLALAMVVRPDCEQLARMMDPGLTVITYDKRDADRGSAGLRRLAGQLADGSWEAALVPHRSLRSAVLASSARLNPRVGFDIGVHQLLYTKAVPYRRGIHEVERNFDLLTALAGVWAAVTDTEKSPVTPVLRKPEFLVPEDGYREAENLFADDAGALAALAPGSVWATKRWPSVYWVILAQWLEQAGMDLVWLGGEEDRGLCEGLAETSGAGRVAAGKLSWQGTASVLKRANVLVANDSAPVHLAGAVGCPAVTLFGPTVPAFGFGPLGRGSRSLGVGLGCRPCRLHGSGKCPEGHFKCMKDLKPASVLRAVVDTIQDTSAI